jgi:hypothetical protein
MSTTSNIDFENTKETKRYSSFPEGGLSDADYRALRKDEMLKDVHPIAGFPSQDRITHFGFTYGGYRRFVGWNAEDEEWIQMVKMPDNLDVDEPVEFEVVSVFEDEDGDAILHFEEYITDGDLSVEALYEYLSDYIDHIYGEEDAPIVFHPTEIGNI